jgi:hypothetical protein
MNFVYEINPLDSLSYCNFEKLNNNLMSDFTKTNNVNAVNIIPSEIKVKHY